MKGYHVFSIRTHLSTFAFTFLQKAPIQPKVPRFRDFHPTNNEDSTRMRLTDNLPTILKPIWFSTTVCQLLFWITKRTAQAQYSTDGLVLFDTFQTKAGVNLQGENWTLLLLFPYSHKHIFLNRFRPNVEGRFETCKNSCLTSYVSKFLKFLC